MSATVKAPWMPDFQKDEWVQYFLVGKVSRAGNLGLAQLPVPRTPGTAPCPSVPPCHSGTHQGRRCWALPLTRP